MSYEFVLELRQYKNDSIQSKKILVLKFPLFFHCVGDEKARQFQNKKVLTELNRSYIVLALMH